MKKLKFFLGLCFLLVSLMTNCFIYIKEDLTENSSEEKFPEPEIREAVSNSWHNSNTDLCYWNNKYYLIYQHSEHHLYSEKSVLLLMNSEDCINWDKVCEFDPEDYELRDPKFAVINDQLFIYALPNIELSPAPFTTLYTSSKNGYGWDSFSEVNVRGWLFWRPKTLDHKTWYVTAYWHEHGKCSLFKTNNGTDWEFVSVIYEGGNCDETAIEFSADGEAFITARLEGELMWHGGSFSASTLIAHSSFPYKEWKYKKTITTRLDGPVLWRIDSVIFAAGRYEPDAKDTEYGMGSLFNRKRTAVFVLLEDTLIVLKILPSSGDTAYPGVIVKNGYVYLSYYTNDPGIECSWSIGSFLPTKIMIAKFNVNELTLAAAVITEERNNVSFEASE